jgi:S-formylglutathione hydrolase FrmB
MGGYAALRIALSHPEAYRAVAAHSAMVLEAIPTACRGRRRLAHGRLQPRLRRAH